MAVEKINGGNSAITGLVKTIQAANGNNNIFTTSADKQAFIKNEDIEKDMNTIIESSEYFAAIKESNDEINISSNSKSKKSASTKSENKYDLKADFDTILKWVFNDEGIDYTNYSNDNGGETKFGITSGTLEDYKNRFDSDFPCKNVEDLILEQAEEIYYNAFWIPSGAQEYYEKGNKAYAYALFDASIQHGPGWAAGADEEAKGDVDKFMKIRKQYYIDIIDEDYEENKEKYDNDDENDDWETQKPFAKGWENRWNNVFSRIDENHKHVKFNYKYLKKSN